jgi:hypothetical protein
MALPGAAPTLDVANFEDQNDDVDGGEEEAPKRRGGGALWIAGGAAAVVLLGSVLLGVVAVAGVGVWWSLRPGAPPPEAGTTIDEVEAVEIEAPTAPDSPKAPPLVIEPVAEVEPPEPRPEDPTPTVRPTPSPTPRETSPGGRPPAVITPAPRPDPTPTAVPAPEPTPVPVEPVKPTADAKGKINPDWSVVLGVRRGMKDGEAERLLGAAQVTGSDYCRAGEVPRSHLNGNVIVCQLVVGGARRVFVLNGVQRVPGVPSDPKIALLGMNYDEVEAYLGSPQSRDGSGRWRYNSGRVWIDFSGGKARAFLSEL